MRRRIMLKLFSWFTFLQVVIFVAATIAQDKDKKGVIIRSDPPGAMLYFKGENSFVGVTPFNIKPNLTGRYEITLVKSGYEKVRVDYNFKGNEKGVLKLSLAPKTPLKAGIRSLIFPGWGQMYSERKQTGVLISLVGAGVGIYTLVAHNDYNSAYNKYEKAMKEFEAANSWDNSVEKYNILVQKHKTASNAFDKRQTWLYIMGGIWIYNFLDSMILFPSFDHEIFNRSLPGVSANFQNDGVGLTMSFSF